jgi:uncharacterized protein YdeI (YjbR/CyaY-like superfamily)
MRIGKTLYVTTRSEWRKWLTKHHKTESEIWLLFYKKDTGKPRIPYTDAVEEALCFGWIDSIQKGVDKKSSAQRFSPRKPMSVLSETNKERIRRLIAEGRMTQVGLDAVAHAFDPIKDRNHSFRIAADILQALKQDREVWRNFKQFPKSYQTIRVAWIETARKRPAEFAKRLRYFQKMTKANKRFGMVQ